MSQFGILNDQELVFREKCLRELAFHFANLEDNWSLLQTATAEAPMSYVLFAALRKKWVENPALAWYHFFERLTCLHTTEQKVLQYFAAVFQHTNRDFDLTRLFLQCKIVDAWGKYLQ